MVSDAASEYESQWATITLIAPKIGCTPEALRRWYAIRNEIPGSVQVPQ